MDNSGILLKRLSHSFSEGLVLKKLPGANPPNFKIKSSHQDYLDMLVINKGLGINHLSSFKTSFKILFC